jgi:predicted HicB family RNase H-like nuclease
MASNKPDEGQHADTKRLSISVPHDVYQALELRAASNDVSLAWVVRKALAEYLDQDIPLLRTGS